MTTKPTFEHIRQLLIQLTPRVSENAQPIIHEITATLNALESELATSSRSSTDPSSNSVLDNKTGCYRFADDPAFYCPHCFDRDQYRSATQRINSKLRVCTHCRSSIKSIARRLG